jgi:Uma2 family endonuclease
MTISPGQSTRRLTLDEWATLPEDTPGELVDGVLVEEEMPSFLHEAVVTWLIRVVGSWAAENGARVAGSGAKFAVSETRGRTPDLTLFLRDQKRPPAHDLVRVPPSIALEVVSPSAGDERRDRVHKLVEYAAFGIRRYWIVDPELRTFEILELDDSGRYRHVVAVTEGTVAIPDCDGLTLNVDALWAEADAVIAEGKDQEHQA